MSILIERIRAERDALRTTVDTLRAELATLTSDLARYETTAENCDRLRAELAAIKGQVPTWKRKDGVLGCKAFMTNECYQAQSAIMQANYERAAPVAKEQVVMPAVPDGYKVAAWCMTDFPANITVSQEVCASWHRQLFKVSPLYLLAASPAAKGGV